MCPQMFSLAAELLSPDVSGLNLVPIDDPGASPTPGFSSGSTSSSLPAPGWASPKDLDVISSEGGEASPHPVSSTGRTSRGVHTPGLAWDVPRPSFRYQTGHRSGICCFFPRAVRRVRTPSPPRDAPQASFQLMAGHRSVILPSSGEASPHPVSSTGRTCLEGSPHRRPFLGRTSTLLLVSDRASLGDMLLLPSSGEASPHPVSSTGRTSSLLQLTAGHRSGICYSFPRAVRRVRQLTAGHRSGICFSFPRVRTPSPPRDAPQASFQLT